VKSCHQYLVTYDDLLHASVGELHETSHSICRSAGGNIASVRYLVCRVNRMYSWIVKQTAFAMYSSHSALPFHPTSHQSTIATEVLLQIAPFLLPSIHYTIPHCLSATTKQGTAPTPCATSRLTSHHTVLSAQSRH
jgi:hypothetical protein